MPRKCSSFERYIDRIENRLLRDLQAEYPEAETDWEGAVWDVFSDLYAEDASLRFIFVLDEWDFIFHQAFVTERDKRDF